LEKHFKNQTARFELSLNWKYLRSVHEYLLITALPEHRRIAMKLARAGTLQDAKHLILERSLRREGFRVSLEAMDFSGGD